MGLDVVQSRWTLCPFYKSYVMFYARNYRQSIWSLRERTTTCDLWNRLRDVVCSKWALLLFNLNGPWCCISLWAWMSFIVNGFTINGFGWCVRYERLDAVHKNWACLRAWMSFTVNGLWCCVRYKSLYVVHNTWAWVLCTVYRPGRTSQ